MPSKCDLFYHIEEEQLVIIKTNPLIKREKNNYENISHPFIPIFYGTMKDGQRTSLVIEYINGQTFDNIKNMKLEEDCMFKIIFDLCSIFQYLHKNEYIYRDLKPDNVILDKNNQIVLIDFDRMIQETDINDQDITRDLGSDFAAPEIKSGGTPSYKSDIYSLGKMIVFIIGGNENKNKILLLKHHIFQTYIDEKPENRPSVLNLIQSFSRVLYNLGVIYTTGEYISRDMNKAIHYFSLAANQNDPEAQFNLGLIYERGEYISRDMNKAIHYYSLAANQNDPEAQYNLGLIYERGEYISRDMNKAIHYYSLAANQNDPKAQYNLGVIYERGEYISRDMNKAIHYYSLAANQNDPKAQFNLGVIYATGEYISRDMNKAIHYFSLAANQNDPEAQFNLGLIYERGEYISRDMNKAIHYYSLAANQNDPEAQFNLGVIYERGEYISRDMNKAIHYYSLAANQNDPKAQYNLGVIYATGEYISRDMNKAIHYYSLAANQNHPQAQYGFGLLYASGKYIPRDMNKAIHYYSLAAKQNYPKAQYNLGLIYFLGIFKKQNIYKGIYYICNSAFNGNKQANFSVGFLFHDGKYYGKDIRRAIKYYKEASSFNNQYAKNNLGIIYKNGFGDEIQPNIGLANEYFKEAINQKNDKIAMYNLAHMYLYNEQYKEEFDIIDLLIRSINVNFEDSLTLLCIALFKKYGCDINKIIKRLNENAIKAKNISMIDCKLITNKSSYEQLYKHYKNIDFLYDISMNPIKSNQIGKQEKKVITNGKAKEITSIFYEGFGIDIN